jgi:hypothetical protein
MSMSFTFATANRHRAQLNPEPQPGRAQDGALSPPTDDAKTDISLRVSVD